MNLNHPTDNNLSISIRPRQCFAWLACAITALILVSTVSRWLAEFTSLSWADDFNRLFDVDTERSIPTLFSTVLLLISALLLGIISIFKRLEVDRFIYHWLTLALAFLYLSVDENVSIHELFMWYLQKRFLLEGVFRFAWVIVAIPVVLGTGILYFKFLFSLPARTRNFVFASALTYVVGALGMEMIGGEYSEQSGFNMVYATITTIEETLEMFGIALFIYSLLDYLKCYQKIIQLNFKH
jgi:hypothetical protein